MNRALVLTILMSLFSLGCSNQWREGSPDRTPEEVMQMLQEAQGASSTGVSTGDLSAALQYQDQSTIYFADAPSNVALVPNLLSFYDFANGVYNFQWLGAGAEYYSWDSISDARVFFFDHWDEQTQRSLVGLVIGVNQGNGFVYHAFSGQQIASDEGEFRAELNGSGGTIYLHSFDVVDGALSDVIQLKVYTDSSFSRESYAGKISTLIGYY